MKPRGHFCRVCGRRRPNEQFGGRGHRIHLCKDCQRLPRDKRDRIERLDELQGFFHQGNISQKNIQRLAVLSQHSDPDVTTLARLVLDVARVLPGKRNRWLKLATRHPDLFDRAVRVLGVEFFEELLSGYGDFDNPLWGILEKRRAAPSWTSQFCSCGSGMAFRDCCMERENLAVDGS